MNWYLVVLRKYAVFNGRARRKEFWFFLLFDLFFGFALVGADVVLGTYSNQFKIGLLSGVYQLALVVPSLAVLVRRLHDIGLSGWWILIGLIPFLGPLALLVLAAFPSQPGQNGYGPCPLPVDSSTPGVPA
jgi:uncharacterized membrane protein YhaH (DUF805 family)